MIAANKCFKYKECSCPFIRLFDYSRTLYIRLSRDQAVVGTQTFRVNKGAENPHLHYK